jgi:hypothetical protein
MERQKTKYYDLGTAFRSKVVPMFFALTLSKWCVLYSFYNNINKWNDITGLYTKHCRVLQQFAQTFVKFNSYKILQVFVKKSYIAPRWETQCV